MSDLRSRSRQDWPIEVRSLADPEKEDLSRTTTPEERLAMVWTLTLEGWALAGQAIPDYPRRHTPISFRSGALAR
jgi:hypothetical protein